MVAFNSISNTLDIFFLYPITKGIDKEDLEIFLKVLNKMKEKGKLSFEDIKRIIDRSVNKTNEFINSMIERGLIEKVNSNEYILKSK